jgi:hypothetical protein
MTTPGDRFGGIVFGASHAAETSRQLVSMITINDDRRRVIGMLFVDANLLVFRSLQ